MYMALNKITHHGRSRTRLAPVPVCLASHHAGQHTMCTPPHPTIPHHTSVGAAPRWGVWLPHGVGVREQESLHPHHKGFITKEKNRRRRHVHHTTTPQRKTNTPKHHTTDTTPQTQHHTVSPHHTTHATPIPTTGDHTTPSHTKPHQPKKTQTHQKTKKNAGAVTSGVVCVCVCGAHGSGAHNYLLVFGIYPRDDTKCSVLCSLTPP
jgi:hypothetical protein